VIRPRAALCAALIPFASVALSAVASTAHAVPQTAAAPPAAAVAATPAALPTGAAPATVPAAAYGSDSWARERLASAGIGVWSSGGCTSRNNPSCTSFEGIRPATIEWVLILAEASGCDLLVTGGTEVGHAAGSTSHANGYRVDLNASACLAGHIQRNFTPVGNGIWRAASGNQYLNEGHHWDVTFF